jgi:hypothetical protein
MTSGKGKNAARSTCGVSFITSPGACFEVGNEVSLNQTEISKVCGISRWKFPSSKKVQKEDHKPRNTGRSPLLSEEEIIELEKFWKEKHKALIVLTIEELITWVSLP